jgi:flagella basal body P-ring formation protein FlgA
MRALLWVSLGAALAFFPAVSLSQVAADLPADVLTRAVMRGAILSSADFERKPMAPALARTALAAADAVGMQTKRDMFAGSILRASDIGPPALVRRGEAVTLEVRKGALAISAPGRALADGGMGEAVRVVNLATNRTLDARVAGTALVSVAMP